jgi:hypothetical protein
VTAGLTSSLLRFGLLDMLVGLVVAILILWSAIQLAIELLHSSTQDQTDLSHYGFWMKDVYNHIRDVHLRDWILDLIDLQGGLAKGDLVNRALQAFDFRNNPWMKLIGLDRQFATETDIEQSLDQLIDHGWVADLEPLSLTLKGREFLKHQDKSSRKLVSSHHSVRLTQPAA